MYLVDNEEEVVVVQRFIERVYLLRHVAGVVDFAEVGAVYLETDLASFAVEDRIFLVRRQMRIHLDRQKPRGRGLAHAGMIRTQKHAVRKHRL